MDGSVMYLRKTVYAEGSVWNCVELGDGLPTGG